METPPNSEQLDSSQRDDKPASACRLRHGLNESCLLYVFEYLDEFELLQLCEMDPYYKELILKWTIRKKCLNLSDSNSSVQMFETFGKSMRKLKITSSKFVVTFATLLKYCEPGQLTEIDIDITELTGVLGRADTTNALFKLVLKAMPIFSNLHKLRFSLYCNVDPSALCTYFLTQISTTAVNLRSLEIDQVEIRENWLQNMRNLEELRIVWKMRSSLDSLVNYFNAKPDLKVFKMLHQGANVTAVLDALSGCCPNLKTFTDMNRNFSTVEYERFDNSLANRYALLSKFAHLNSVTLTTYTFCGSDLHYPLVNLATKNLSKLRILTSQSQPIVLKKEVKVELMRRPLPKFVKPKSVELHISSPNAPDLVFDPKSTRCDLRCEFLIHFLSYANSLQHLGLAGEISNIDRMLLLLPTVRVLDISRASLLNPFKEVSNIVKTVLGSLQRVTRKGVFHLILKDDEKVQYFKQQTDLKDVINFTFFSWNGYWQNRNKWDV